MSLEQMMALAAQVSAQPRPMAVPANRPVLVQPVTLSAEEWAWLFPTMGVPPVETAGNPATCPH